MRLQNPNTSRRTWLEGMRSASLVSGCAVLLCSSAAKAEAPRRFALEYRGGVACPSEREVLAEVQRRAPNAERVTDGALELRVRLSVQSEGVRQHGVIDIEGREGATHRELEAAECAEVVRALALIVALALDPDAATSVQPPATVAAPKPLAAAESHTESPLASRGSEFWWGAGTGVGWTAGVAPKPALSQTLFVELGQGRSTGFSPNARLGGVHAHGSASAPAGSADFELWALRVASCPYRVVAALAFSGCVSFDWGRLQGRGSHTLAARSSAATWSGPGAFVDAALQALPWMRVQLELGAMMPLARDRFYFGPDETVHHIPSLAGYGGLNLRVGD